MREHGGVLRVMQGQFQRRRLGAGGGTQSGCWASEPGAATAAPGFSESTGPQVGTTCRPVLASCYVSMIRHKERGKAQP